MTSSEYRLSTQATIFITNEEESIAKHLALELQRHGFKTSIVEDLPENACQVVILAGLKHIADVNEAIEINRRVFLHFKKIAPDITKQGGHVITVQDTGGDFGLNRQPGIRAWSGGLTGLVKTAAQEWEAVRLKAIDLEQGDLFAEEIAKKIAHEVLFGDDEIEIGLTHDGQRIKLQLTSAAPQVARPLKNNPLLLVSGGARGITAHCLREYAKKHPSRFVLLGRSRLTDEEVPYQDIKDTGTLKKVLIEEAKQNGILSPKEIEKKLQTLLAIREIKATLLALSQLGSEAVYLNVDIQDQQQLTRAIDQVRTQYGSIDGIIHAAGVLADKLIADNTLKQFNAVFDTKVTGLKNILSAVAHDPLSLIIAFSSVSARFGNKGQAAYAMANEVLNKVMQAEKKSRGDACQIKSINWGAWDMGMVNPALKEMFQQRGIKLLSAAEGPPLFADEVRDCGPHVEVVLGSPLRKAEARADIVIDKIKDAYLLSHVVQTHPVVPAVLGFEWLLRALTQRGQNACDYTFTDLKILKGITLTDFDKQAYQFTVQQQSSRLVLKKQESVFYMVTLNKRMSDDSSALFDLATVLQNSTSWPFTVDQAYGGLLFHGPHFNAIQRFDAFTPQGGSVMLTGMLSHKNWPNENWSVDVVLLDGIMQASGLWCFARNNQFVMPTGIGAITIYQPGVIKEEVYCVFECKSVNELKVLVNAVCLDKQNRKIAELRDITMITIR